MTHSSLTLLFLSAFFTDVQKNKQPPKTTLSHEITTLWSHTYGLSPSLPFPPSLFLFDLLLLSFNPTNPRISSLQTSIPKQTETGKAKRERKKRGKKKKERKTWEPVLLFRPTKKRKAYRARPSAQDDDDDEHKQQQQQREQTGPGLRTTTIARNRRNGEAPGDNNDSDDDNNNDNDSSDPDSDDGNYDGVAAALRARSMRRKLHGVNFQSSSNSHGGRRGADPWSLGNTPPEDDDADGAGASQVAGMSNRFMHQTGLVKDHSAKHLYAFFLPPFHPPLPSNFSEGSPSFPAVSVCVFIGAQ